MRARMYDPTTGRFLSTDPAAAGPSAPYISAYAYVNNNPLRYTDPSGECFVWCVAALVGGIVGGITSTAGYIVSSVVTGQDLDLGQGLVAFGTGAISGAVCTATLFLACAAANTGAGLVQYQLSPGDKDLGGYLVAATIGVITSKLAFTPVKPTNLAPALLKTIPMAYWTDEAIAGGIGGFARSFLVSTLAGMVQTTLGANSKPASGVSTAGK